MKFRITATSKLGWYDCSGNGEHTAKLTRDYGFLKGRVNSEHTKSPMLPETTIEIKDLDELMQLVNSLSDREIIIYKNYYYDDMNNRVYDDKYTLEIYDDYRE